MNRTPRRVIAGADRIRERADRPAVSMPSREPLASQRCWLRRRGSAEHMPDSPSDAGHPAVEAGGGQVDTSCALPRPSEPSAAPAAATCLGPGGVPDSGAWRALFLQRFRVWRWKACPLPTALRRR